MCHLDIVDQTKKIPSEKGLEKVKTPEFWQNLGLS